MSTMGGMMNSEEDFAAGEAECFPKGNGKDAAPESQVMEVVTPLPDGIGMTYESIQGIIAAKHKTAVFMDDPIMMLVTICNVNLAEMEKLNKRHNDAVTQIMADQSAKYIAAVKATTDDLGKVLTENSVEAIRVIFASHSQALNLNSNNVWLCTSINVVAALVILAMMAIKMWS